MEIYQKKDVYLQNKERKLLMIIDEYNSIIMEYLKTVYLLDKKPNQPSKFRTKKWVKINDHLRGTFSTYSQFIFKTLMLNLNLCDCSNAYILVKGSITVVGAGTTAAARQVDRNHKQVIEN